MTIGPIEIMVLLALLPVVGGSAFASCSETVLFGLRQSEREKLRRERPATARRVDELLRDPRGLLVTVLFINMTSNTLFFVISSGFILMSNSSPMVEFGFALISLVVLVIAGEKLWEMWRAYNSRAYCRRRCSWRIGLWAPFDAFWILESCRRCRVWLAWRQAAEFQ